jgi:2-succinyl-5-enolpyruvyl-6-hydroxy-3-cyclohexene-1-carboxylate synthase
VEFEAVSGSGGGDVFENLFGLLETAELLRVRVDHWAGHTRRRGGVELVWLERDVEIDAQVLVGGCSSETCFEASLSDVAPRAHDVGEDVDRDRGASAGWLCWSGVGVHVTTVEADGTAAPYRRGPMADTDRPPLAEAAPVDVQATFCSTLVDQWLRLGVRHAVVAPGSRSTPMALALTDRAEMQVHVVHDERVAAFIALGLGLSPGEGVDATPALLLCTSGTATANFLPAVAEAGLSEVPMIVLTADRPEELRGVGAPQTIDQRELYGAHVRWFHDPGVPEAATSGEWRQLAARAWSNSAAGPVQLNLPFREPLVGTPTDLPDSVEAAVDVPETGVISGEAAPDAMATERGVILVGGMSGVRADSIGALQVATGWPILADPQSGMRHLSDVTAVDALLRVDGFADEYLPDVIVRVGRPSTSKVLAQWSARPEVTLIQVGGPGCIDPSGTVDAVCAIEDLIDAVGERPNRTRWLAEWRRQDDVASTAITRSLEAREGLTEPAAARTLVDQLPPDAQMTVSSSMPVRDVEWYGGRTPFVHSNRGANGIDGVISTSLGRALGQPAGAPPSFVLIGDLAFVHDSNALVGLNRRGVDLRIVVVDNDGGGIFSFLPQSTLLAHERFERLFGTPLGTDVLALAAAHGVDTATATTVAELADQIGRSGPWVCRVPSERQQNVAVHASLHDAVAAAMGA